MNQYPLPTLSHINRSMLTALIGMALALAPGADAAKVVKLNDALGADADVSSSFITPDGKKVVYLADRDSDGQNELFVVPIDGGTPLKLNHPLPAGSSVRSLKITPDSNRVIYFAEGTTSLVEELYSVPITGGAVVKLNGTLTAGGTVSSAFSFIISPDGATVVYVADQDIDDVFEIYAVPVTGGASLKLNPALTAGQNVFSFRVSPDGARVVYVADQDSPGQREIYSVPLTGGVPVKLNAALPAGGNVFSFLISPQGNLVVYLADEDTFGVRELYSVSIGGGTSVKRSGTLTAGGDVILYRYSPTGTRVVYLADQETNSVNELYSVGFNGDPPVKLNGPLVANGDVESSGGFIKFSPDGKHVVYRADETTLNQIELYSVPTEGGPRVQLNGAFPVFGFVSVFHITSDSSRVIFNGDLETDSVDEVFSVPITGGSMIKLNAPFVPGGILNGLLLSPDGRRAIYLAEQEVDNVRGIYSVPATGGVPAKLNGPLVAGGTPGFPQFSPDGSRAVYLADQDIDDKFELFSSTLQIVWQPGAGDWDTVTNWDLQEGPETIMQAVIASPALVTMTGAAKARTIDSLALGGGGSSILELEGNAALTARTGFDWFPGGILRGDGSLTVLGSELAIPSGAEIRAGPGDQLRVASSGLNNSGRVEAFGGAFSPAELEFTAPFLNESSTGLIAAHHASLRFPGDLTNEGTLSLTGGFNDLIGDVDNRSSPQGRIIVSGGATAIFYDDVVNSGIINASASGTLQSVAAFFGSFSGNGVGGGGHVFLEGDSQPGFSPGVMTFGGDLSYGPFASVEIEIGGTTPGTEHDQIQVTGNLELNGELEVSLINGFVPTVGQSFDLWNADSASGSFQTITLPALPAGRFWNTSQVNANGLLSVGCVPNSYADYAALHGLAGGPTDDDDLDASSNLLEYVLAQDPTLADAFNAQPTVIHNGPNDEFTFTMASPLGSDITLFIQSSGDLINWTTDATRSALGVWSGSITKAPAVIPGKVDVTLTNPTALPRQFYRLGVELAP